MNEKNPNAIKVTLDNGMAFIVEGINIPAAIAHLRRRGRLSTFGEEVAYAAKIYFDFSTEVVK